LLAPPETAIAKSSGGDLAGAIADYDAGLHSCRRFVPRWARLGRCDAERFAGVFRIVDRQAERGELDSAIADFDAAIALGQAIAPRW